MSDTRFINQYPYTDFHELNLDWVINEVQSLKTTVDTIMSDQITSMIDKYFNQIMPDVIYTESTRTITLQFEPIVTNDVHTYSGSTESLDIGV